MVLLGFVITFKSPYTLYDRLVRVFSETLYHNFMGSFELFVHCFLVYYIFVFLLNKKLYLHNYGNN